ncbi:MAG: quinone-interacting membrane-bound oxidoreductase complex subunit QmoC [Chloroflexota bacterium]
MTQTAEPVEVLQPDNQFIADVLKLGGQSAKKCYQCGTCTVSCNVSYAQGTEESFPRQLMLGTQWGLGEKVLRDPAIWACHQCQDCSANCPRGAKPGDVLGALRALAIERYATPRFLARWYRQPAYLPLLLAVPAIILLGLLFLFQVQYPAGPIIYKHFISEIYIEIAGVIVAGLAALAAVTGLWRFWLDMRLPATAPAVDGPGALAATTPAPREPVRDFADTMVASATHADFRACGAESSRTWGHLATMYGFPLLIIATAISFLYTLLGIEQQERSLLDPMKIAGNLGGLLALGGVGLLLYRRFQARSAAWGVATYYDWLLLWLIFANVTTGFLMQFSRFAGAAGLAYSLYVVHLVIVFTSFAYVPYGKLAHLYYRGAALAALRHGRKTAPLLMLVLVAAGVVAALAAAAVAVAILGGVAWLLGAR